MGWSWLERASKDSSGSVISKSVGSLFYCGIRAKILCLSSLFYLMVSITGMIEGLGEISISSSLVSVCLINAYFLV